MSPFFHAYITDILRPWKILTLLLGIGLLIIGSLYAYAPDWDITISLIMGISTYLTAPEALRIFIRKQWTYFPIALFMAWVSIDGLYALYWSIYNPIALETMRSANFFASSILYLFCGGIWYYE